MANQWQQWWHGPRLATSWLAGNINNVASLMSVISNEINVCVI